MNMSLLHYTVNRVSVRSQNIMTGKDNPFSVSDIEAEEYSIDDMDDSFHQYTPSVESSDYISEIDDESREDECDEVYSSTPLTHYTDVTYDVSNVRRRLFTSVEDSEVNYTVL